jgi:hypothetical protein
MGLRSVWNSGIVISNIYITIFSLYCVSEHLEESFTLRPIGMHS